MGQAGLAMNRLRRIGLAHFRQVIKEPEAHVSGSMASNVKVSDKTWPRRILEMTNDGPQKQS